MSTDPIRSDPMETSSFPDEDAVMKQLYQLAIKYHEREQPRGDAPDYFSEARPILRSLLRDSNRLAVKTELEALQAEFGDRGIVTFDMPYDEEAEAVAVANVLNKISDRISMLKAGLEGAGEDGA